MSGAGSPKRVLIVDDSAIVRAAMTEIINAHPDLEVMAVAQDPIIAESKMRAEMPDVITLDVEMPRMDGITFLRRIMAQRPMPVIICSSLVGDGTATLDAALEAGATDVIAKPKLGTKEFLQDSATRIQEAVLGAANARVGRQAPARRAPAQPAEKLSVDAVLPQRAPGAAMRATEKVVAIGASTGGTEALREVLQALPPNAPPIVIVQHMPGTFTPAFAKRLDRLCRIDVKEAEQDDQLHRGRVLIAPGDSHLLLKRSGTAYSAEVRAGPLVNRHRPSVDVLFRSVAQIAGANAVGVIMTGMGDDGAKGLKEMRATGARTLGQNEASCVVYGMPRVAKLAGAVEKELDLGDLAAQIVRIAAN